MQRFFILAGHFAFASLLTFVLASIVHSQFVLQGLLELGIHISLSDRLAMTVDDIKGLFATLGAIISFSLLLGFLTVYALNKFIHTVEYAHLLYPLAGGVAIWVMLAAMHPIMNITVVASARSQLGILSLGLCGVVGGALFWRLRKVQPH